MPDLNDEPKLYMRSEAHKVRDALAASDPEWTYVVERGDNFDSLFTVAVYDEGGDFVAHANF